MAHQRLAALLVALITSLGLLVAEPANAGLPQGNAVKDPAAILRDALPFEQPDLRDLQHRLESTSDDLRAKRWSALSRSLTKSQAFLSTRRDSILAWRRVSSITHNQDEQQWWDFFAYNLGTDADWPAYVPR